MITRRQAFSQIGACGAALTGTAALAISCQPVEAPAAIHDPMLDLIGRYRTQLAIYDASRDMSDDEADAFAEATYLPHWRELCDSPPVPTTEAGAIEALRVSVEEMANCGGSFELPVVRAALAYFDGRAS